MPNSKENEKYLAELTELEEKDGVEAGLQTASDSKLTKQEEKDLEKEFVRIANKKGLEEAERVFRERVKDMTAEDIEKNLPQIRAINFIISMQEDLEIEKSALEYMKTELENE